ncbi:MAG: NTP transferase domain-containing protein [Oscillospiraceae bacterium]|nr:NTP transferase domain-containing protein [Oscillospiraceae bacterium]
MIAMTKERFDLLVALEADRDGLTAEVLAERTGLTADEVSALLSDLTAEGLVCDGKITALGLEALEPYRTRRAIFIAAGFGSRLRPVTLDTAKPLIRVGGTRIIDTLIDSAMAAGIEEICVVCGYLGEQFRQLKEKYPNIQLFTNPMYTEANNISSVYLLRDRLCNTYICEADLLVHHQVFDKYVFHSCYLGIPTDETDDWYFKTNDQGTICELGIGAKDCYRMLGISYWDREDGKKLNEHVAATFAMPGGKDEDWCYVPLVSFKQAYQVHVRQCAMDDIEEIDTYDELCALDPSYIGYGK